MATHKHTHTRIKQCSDASVGLAQARPNKCIIWYHVIYQLTHGTLENLTTTKKPSDITNCTLLNHSA